MRARRGEATDSHSLAERVVFETCTVLNLFQQFTVSHDLFLNDYDQVRREKISQRMKLLQGLVPGCDKVIVSLSFLLFFSPSLFRDYKTFIASFPFMITRLQERL